MDPYKVLGVDPGATDEEVKKSISKTEPQVSS